jgi:flagellar motility protein MotE (MotC chaperone)
VSARPILKHFRLLPAVITLGAALLAIKGEGLLEAQAQNGKSSPASTATKTSDPASDPSEAGSASAVDVLTNLSHRRAELDAREQALATRENLIAAAAKRVEERISDLKAMQTKLQMLLGQRDVAEQKQFDQLVKSYTSMRPKDAARIFDSLNETVLVPVAAAMKADVLGAILAQMQPEQAQKLTVKLADRLNAKQIETPAPQLAALTQAGAPAPVTPAPSGTAAATPTTGAAATPAAQTPAATAGTASSAPTPAPPAAAPQTPGK